MIRSVSSKLRRLQYLGGSGRLGELECDLVSGGHVDLLGRRGEALEAGRESYWYS